ncbi:hypothetical protein HNV11_11580 [Spirosoma taeanense]|uniref:Uncharacterized protein n=1 Tax=Spirosoma taeanense TaxID=2735870 RepID=A0A6M5Y9M0_9BACT|nr:hypothetical protein [Spirosoma taeanense]QJW89970.1 hypothetical protein HNV11_11580 [Spirosoma taeanense]
MKKCLKITLYVLGGLLVLSLIGRITRKATPAEIDGLENQQKAAVIKAARPNARRDLTINKHTWQKGEAGSMALHSFSIYNASKQHDYTTIRLRFFYYSDLGVEVGHSDQVIDKTVRVGQTIRINKFVAGLIPQHTFGADMEFQ